MNETMGNDAGLTGSQKKVQNLRWYRGQWYIDATRHGERICHSLKTTNQREAVKAMRAELEAYETAWRAGRMEEYRRLANPHRPVAEAKDYATIGEVLSRYMAGIRALGVAEKTAGNYLSSLCLVAFMAEEDLRKQKVDILTGAMVVAFEERMLARRGDDSGRRSIASMLRQARAIFSEDAMRLYEGLELPDLRPFLKGGNVKKVPGVQYMTPFTHPELCRETPKRIAELRETRADLWLACSLMYGLALRNSEAAAARWSWVSVDPQNKELVSIFICDRPEEGFRVKAKGSTRRVPIHREQWEQMQALRLAGDEYILPGGNATRRRYLCGRDLSAWMRSIGWTNPPFEKAAYELRKLRGSEWFTDPTIGPAQASKWLGHCDLTTTCKFYAHMTTQAAPRAM